MYLDGKAAGRVFSHRGISIAYAHVRKISRARFMKIQDAVISARARAFCRIEREFRIDNRRRVDVNLRGRHRSSWPDRRAML